MYVGGFVLMHRLTKASKCTVRSTVWRRAYACMMVLHSAVQHAFMLQRLLQRQLSLGKCTTIHNCIQYHTPSLKNSRIHLPSSFWHMNDRIQQIK